MRPKIRDFAFNVLIVIGTCMLVGGLHCNHVYGQPKLSMSANRTSSGSSITVNQNERVSIRISAAQGSTIGIDCVPLIKFITPPDNSEITFYAQKSVVFIVMAFKDGIVNKQRYLVTVGNVPGPNPGPEPGPGPKPPGPKPNVPTSKIGKAIYAAAKLVSSPTKANDIKTLVDEFNALKAKAAATSMTYEQLVIAAVQVFGKVKPESSKQKWKAFALGALGIYKSNGVKDKNSMISALEETIKGLEAAK